jgi:hypothetical protein
MPVSGRCDQQTRRDERCERRATWIGGDGEHYCTQHANYYGVARRGGHPIDRGAVDVSERELLESTDAMVWARAFVQTISAHREADPYDEGFVVGWFANAMAATNRGAVDPVEAARTTAQTYAEENRRLRRELEAAGRALNRAGWIDDSQRALDALRGAVAHGVGPLLSDSPEWRAANADPKSESEERRG